MAAITEHTSYVHPHGAPPKGTILMVASSPTISSQTGWPIGFWASELTHPMLAFRDAGYAVDITSTEGGAIQMDGYSDPMHESLYSAHDVITLGFMQRPEFRQMLENTRAIADVDPAKYDAIYLVGGQGPMYTFRNNPTLQSLFRSFFESGRPSAVVCHAATLLLEATTTDGHLIVAGKTWTGFSNAEEDYVEQAIGMRIQPYRIEDEAKKLPSTTFKVSAPLASYAIADGNLITGQQQNSGMAVAELVIQKLVSTT